MYSLFFFLAGLMLGRYLGMWVTGDMPVDPVHVVLLVALFGLCGVNKRWLNRLVYGSSYAEDEDEDEVMVVIREIIRRKQEELSHGARHERRTQI